VVKNEVVGRQQALSMAIGLDTHADDYTGLLSPLEFNGWPSVDKQSRAYLYIITKVLAIEQIRPLLIAVIEKFEPAQIRTCMRMFLSWSVRFLVAGYGGGG